MLGSQTWHWKHNPTGLGLEQDTLPGKKLCEKPGRGSSWAGELIAPTSSRPAEVTRHKTEWAWVTNHNTAIIRHPGGKGCPPERPWHTWEVSWHQSHEDHKAKCEVLHLDCGDPRHIDMLGGEVTESHNVDKHLGGMAGEKLDMSWQCALVVWKTKGVLGCIKSSAASSVREAILSLYSALLRSHLQYSVQ